MLSNSVFMKKVVQDYKIEYESIIKTIPENSYEEPQEDKKNKIETRWRFLEIRNTPTIKTVVEISKCKPGFEREYLNKNMKWIPASVDPIFDQYVVKQYYYYSDQ